MVRFHCKDGRVFNLKLRASLAGIRSEAKFREAVEKYITDRENKPGWEAYGASLRDHWENGREFYVLSILGILTAKWRIK